MIKAQQREWLHMELMAHVWPDLPDTAAEAMEAEMPVGWEVGDNWTAGPTYSEVWWREWEEELEARHAC